MWHENAGNHSTCEKTNYVYIINHDNSHFNFRIVADCRVLSRQLETVNYIAFKNIVFTTKWPQYPTHLDPLLLSTVYIGSGIQNTPHRIQNIFHVSINKHNTEDPLKYFTDYWNRVCCEDKHTSSNASEYFPWKVWDEIPHSRLIVMCFIIKILRCLNSIKFVICELLKICYSKFSNLEKTKLKL
jgi:hypothetical protein